MNQAKRYCMLHIPESGLFYAEGKFFDGDGNGISWDGNMPVFLSRADADRRKKKRAAEGLRYIILGFEPIEKGTDK